MALPCSLGWLCSLTQTRRRHSHGPRADEALKPHPLQEQGVHRDDHRASRHRKRRNLGTQEERIEHPGGERKGDHVVARGPPQILVHLAQRRARKPDGLDDVKWIAAHQNDVGALDGDVGPGADGETEIGLCQCRRVVDAVADHAHAMTLRLAVP